MADGSSGGKISAARPLPPEPSARPGEESGAAPFEPAALKESTKSPPPQAPASESPAKPTAQPPRHNRLRAFLFLLLPVALLIGGYYYITGGRIMSTENAYLRADIVGISTDVSGIVDEVAVHENQKVKTGDVLFKLDGKPFRLALTRAKAQVGIVGAQINALKASYKDMQAQIRQAQVDVDFFGRELDRQSELAKKNYASEAAFDQAKRNEQSAKQKVASLQHQLEEIAANLAGDPDIPVEKHPRYIEAVAQRDEAARQLAHATVRAPMDGIVTNVPSLQPGQYLPASTVAFNLVATDHMWIEAQPKETELTYVRPGQPVSITVDTYPGQEWQGVVDSISPASAASFSLLPAQNTSGNWVKVVQRIPMRVRIETPAGKPPLRAGMSAIVNVDTGHERGLPQFLTSLASLFGAESETQRG
jgi:membrane fusion protein (multidrug efflux system)